MRCFRHDRQVLAIGAGLGRQEMSCRPRLARAFLALALVVSIPAIAAGEAGIDDRFDVFLEKFISDSGFRSGRIVDPLPVKVGNVQVQDVQTERWSRADVRKKLTSLLPPAELKAQGLSQRVRKISGSRVEVSQWRPGTSDVLLTYRFQKLRGAWMLTHFDDASRQPASPPPPG